MRKSYLAMMIAGLSLFSAMPALSQVQMAQSQIAGAIKGPKFVPSGIWVVQPNKMSSERGLANIDLPCMMSASYDNGYSVRFSGAKGNILAMAIDFRQDVFAQGRKYPAEFVIGKGQVRRISGTAFSKNALLFNMRDVQGAHSALAGATQMSLNIEDNPMIFQLSNMGGALRDFCLLYTSPSPRDRQKSRMPSSA